MHRDLFRIVKVALEIYGDGIEMEVYFAVPSPLGVLPPGHRSEAVPLIVADPEDACSPLSSRHLAGKLMKYPDMSDSAKVLWSSPPVHTGVKRDVYGSEILFKLDQHACHVSVESIFVAGAALLVKRGGCTFSEKAQAAAAAHAAALIVYNNDEGLQGNTQSSTPLTCRAYSPHVLRVY